jgi:hypothetical protein
LSDNIGPALYPTRKIYIVLCFIFNLSMCDTVMFVKLLNDILPLLLIVFYYQYCETILEYFLWHVHEY